jgi:spermidine/putrescine ABC transporter ATP-binding subunit
MASSGGNGTAFVRFEKIEKSFDGETLVIKNLNLEIAQGEFLTMLGPSGSGKTTTLMMLAGFETPTHGEIYLDDQPIGNIPPHRRNIGMVFQNYALFPHMTVSENLAYPLEVRKRSKSEINDRVSKALEMVELQGFGGRFPAQLSGGQQQRVALARALVMEPKVLLMDEPLSNLDAKLREQMRTEIRRIQKRLGITSVYVTHDQVEAMTLSDRIVVMNEGEIEQIGSPTEIYRRPQTRFVADFIGQANFVEGTIREQLDGKLVLEALGCRMTVSAPAADHKVGGAATLVVRPEMVEIDSPEGQVDGLVRRATYLGNVIEYDIEVEGQMLSLVEHDPRHTTVHAEGASVRLNFLEDCLYVLPERR